MDKAWAVAYLGVIRQEDGEDILFAEREMALQNMKRCVDRWPGVKTHSKRGFSVVSVVPGLLDGVGKGYHYGERALCTTTRT